MASTADVQVQTKVEAAADRATYYNEDIAADYSDVTQQDPWWEHCEVYTTRLLLDDIQGYKVLDLGCGEGRSVRNMLSWGAAKGVGVDISEHMIDIARSKRTPNTEFLVMDSAQSKLPSTLAQQFDLVTSFWVMQYMSSYVELLSHIRSAYNSLKKGGKFCGIVSAYSDQFPLKGENKVMKVTYQRQSKEEFSPISSFMGGVGCHAGRGVHLCVYSLYPDTINAALKEVGFGAVETLPMGLSKEGEKFYSRSDVDRSFSHVFIFKTIK